MSIIELFLIAVGLSMDAFAVSVCKGLSMKRMNLKKALLIGFYFGGFQALMPCIGYLLGSRFQSKITAIDHWIAFILLAFIGLNMLREAFHPEEDSVNDSVDVKTMLALAVATSIDALAVGITFAFLNVSIIWSASLIGVVTFIFSIIGVKIGNVFGSKYQKRAQIIGGIILILIGTKILVEHLMG